ncbi:MAG: PDZ domain-containing protein, partial [Granulosicoccaceae bacterium]
EVDRDLAKTFGMDRPRGALVADVSDNSPASDAGFEPGDVILSFNGKGVASSAKLPAIVGSTPVETTVDVIVLRAGEETTLKVTVGKLNEMAGNTTGRSRKGTVAGLTLKALNENERKEAGVSSGLLVESIDPDSAAAASGLRSGDILLSLNRKPLTTVKAFRESYNNAPQDRPLPLLVARGNGRLYLPLSPAK